MSAAANKKESTSHYDIIVVGAGLVGASFAALLAKWQKDKHHSPLRIALIDAGNPPSLPNLDANDAQFDPRVVALTHASQSMFASLGLWEKIQTQRACAYTAMHVWDHDGTANIQFAAQEIQQQHLGHIVENSILQCSLLDYLAEQSSVSILRGIKVNSIKVDNIDKSPTVTTLLCEDGTSLSANLIVAADGGHSTIRRLANMDTREWDYHHKAIVATVRTSQPHQFTAWQNFLPSGPLAFLPLDHPSENYCSIVWSLESEKADKIMALNDDEFCHAVSRAFQHRLGDAVSVSQRYNFPLHQRHAVHYVSDNIVLMGDAAHTIHPLAGQGVNLGLLDAQALAQELIRGIERDLPVNEPSILRRYQRQRKVNNVEVMLLMEALKRLFGHKNIAVRWLRNAGLKKVNELTVLKNWLAKQAIKHK